MKKKTIIKLSLIVILILLVYSLYNYLIIKGGPIEKKLTINNCSIDYTYYLTDNQFEYDRSHGHADNNKLTMISAKLEILECLCDNYIKSKQTIDSVEIVNILNSTEYLEAKKLFCKQVIDFKTDTLSITNFCNDKDKYIDRMCLD